MYLGHGPEKSALTSNPPSLLNVRRRVIQISSPQNRFRRAAQRLGRRSAPGRGGARRLQAPRATPRQRKCGSRCSGPPCASSRCAAPRGTMSPKKGTRDLKYIPERGRLMACPSSLHKPPPPPASAGRSGVRSRTKVACSALASAPTTSRSNSAAAIVFASRYKPCGRAGRASRRRAVAWRNTPTWRRSDHGAAYSGRLDRASS